MTWKGKSLSQARADVTVGAQEIKVHLARVLDRVAAGESMVITRHGVPVARLVPYEAVPDKAIVREGIAKLAKLSKAIRRRGDAPSLAEIRSMRDAGRR